MFGFHLGPSSADFCNPNFEVKKHKISCCHNHFVFLSILVTDVKVRTSDFVTRFPVVIESNLLEWCN